MNICLVQSEMIYSNMLNNLEEGEKEKLNNIIPFKKTKKKFHQKLLRFFHYFIYPEDHNLIEKEKAIKLTILF